MSGGHLEYSRYRIEGIINSIEREIENNNNPPYEKPDNNWDKLENERFYAEGGYRWTPETINEFKKGIKLIKQADVYIHRIDYLLSGDDGEDNFHKRLKTELNSLKDE